MIKLKNTSWFFCLGSLTSLALPLAMMSLVWTSTWISQEPILAVQHCLEAMMWRWAAARLRNRSLGLTVGLARSGQKRAGLFFQCPHCPEWLWVGQARPRGQLFTSTVTPTSNLFANLSLQLSLQPALAGKWAWSEKSGRSKTWAEAQTWNSLRF